MRPEQRRDAKRERSDVLLDRMRATRTDMNAAKGRLLIVSLLVAAVYACGGSVSEAPTGAGSPDASVDGRDTGSGTPGRDGGLLVDASIDASLPDGGAICSGTAPRMQINGAEVGILKVQGKAIAMNCCDSGQLMIASDRFAALFYLRWRVAPLGPTGHVDVATLPGPNAVELVLGCDPSTSSCDSAEERFTTGFQGTIDYTNDSTGMITSYCLSVTEPAGAPHTLIHSLQLYAPKIASPY